MYFYFYILYVYFLCTPLSVSFLLHTSGISQPSRLGYVLWRYFYILCFVCFMFYDGTSLFCILYFYVLYFVFCRYNFFLFRLLCVLSIDIIYLVFFCYVSTVHCTSTLTFLNLFVCPSIHTCGQRPCCNCTWPSSLQLHLPGQIQNKYISRFKTNTFQDSKQMHLIPCT